VYFAEAAALMPLRSPVSIVSSVDSLPVRFRCGDEQQSC
jgi:hypothetical protein